MTTNSPVTVLELQAMKQRSERIAMLTCYDASFAREMEQSGVDIILIGDSLGMVVQGRSSTVHVSVDDIAYHTQCVSTALSRTFLLADMPFGSFHDPSTAMVNAVQLMAAGAAMVKIEGAGPMVEVVRYLTERSVPVCGHVGLTPQSVHQLGGFRVQAREDEEADRLIEDARALEQAGAQLIVLEAVPSVLGARLSETLAIPVIGIGAGAQCDGQVLVMHDMLGLGRRAPKFVKNFMDGADSIGAAFAAYVTQVRDGSFPGPEHQY